MSASAADRMKQMMSGKQSHPFDFINIPTFFDPPLQEGTKHAKQQRAIATIQYVAANAVSRGLKFSFIPGPMSSGYNSYRLAEKQADKIRKNTEAHYGEEFLTTQNIKRHIDSTEIKNYVSLPNFIQNQLFIDQAESTFPDYSIIGPADNEGPLRVIHSDPAMTQGASVADQTFETWWGARVRDSSMMILRGDHAFSRNGNIEEIEGDAIQCGLVDHERDHVGAGKEYDIVDGDGYPVPLSDRAWETAKHLIHEVEKDFRSDLAVAALISRFQIDDWLNDPENSPLDMDKVHPVLAKRTKADMERMARLKEIMIPYIAAKCADWTPYKDVPVLKEYFEKNIEGAAKSFDTDTVPAMEEELFAYQPRGGFVYPEKGAGKLGKALQKVKSALVKSFTQASKPVKRREIPSFFKEHSSDFADDHYSGLRVWEQAALPFALGATEAHRLPDAAPRAFFYACEPKGGEKAKAWATRKKISDLAEARSAADQIDDKSGFIQSVIEKNIASDTKTQEDLLKNRTLKGRQVKNIVSTLDFKAIDEAIQDNREFVSAKGADRLSSNARLAMQMEWFDRNAQGLVLRKGWQYHPTEVQMVVRAVLHATGQIDRPYDGGKNRMEIFVHDPKGKTPGSRMKKQNLHDLIATLAPTVEKWLDTENGVPAGETYLACARLLEIADKLSDPGGRNYHVEKNPQTGSFDKSGNKIIDWAAVDGDFYSFWYDGSGKKEDLVAAVEGQSETLRDRLRRKIMAVGLQYIPEEDLSGLDQDYIAAKREASANDNLLKSARGDRQRQIAKHNGPT